MPDRLKAGVENLSGLAMDDVRVHYDSPRPTRLRALAYTQGTEIHLAPGQRRHLAHEAWHAVQQKQGRVRPTFRLRGSAVNDDSSLEREADVMGARAMTGRPREGGLVPALQPGGQPRGEVVQRRAGFEFEATGGWKFDRQKTANDAWEEIADTKATLLETANGLGELSADNGNVEFRTKPLSSLAEVTQTVNELLGFRDRFRGKDTVFVDPDKAYALGKLNGAANPYKGVRIRATQGLSTRPQATLGVKVVDIPKLFRKLVEIRGDEPGRAGRARLEQDYPAYDATSLQRIVGGGVEVNAEDAMTDADAIYTAAVTAAAAAGTAEPAGVRDEIVGFLTMVARIIWDAATAANRLTDMKYAFPLMARTDLRNMFLSLEADARAFVVTLWNAGAGPLATSWPYLDARLFPRKYRGDDGAYHEGPTKLEWLRSIFEDGRQNAQGKDTLSPAPGYNRLEGFGSLGADNLDPKLALLEFRGLATVGMTSTINSDDWRSLAETFFALTDSVLNPPPPVLVAAADPPAPPPPAPDPQPQPVVAVDPQPQAMAAALLAAFVAQQQQQQQPPPQQQAAPPQPQQQAPAESRKRKPTGAPVVDPAEDAGVIPAEDADEVLDADAEPAQEAVAAAAAAAPQHRKRQRKKSPVK